MTWFDLCFERITVAAETTAGEGKGRNETVGEAFAGIWMRVQGAGWGGGEKYTGFGCAWKGEPG